MKILTIKKSSEFQEISKKGNKFHAKTLILLKNTTPAQYFTDKTKGKNAENFCRLGLTVSKKVGNAVARNKNKRRLRHAARQLLAELAKNQFDYVIIAKKEIKDVNFETILRDLRFCLTRIL